MQYVISNKATIYPIDSTQCRNLEHWTSDM